MRKHSVTLKDVARAAGVSLGTASHALRRDPRILADKRKRVEEAADRLGYRKSTAAAMLASQGRAPGQKSLSVAWLTFSTLIKPRVLALIMAKHQRFFEAVGWFFSHFNLTRPEEVPRVTRLLHATGVDGVIVGRCDLPELPPGFPWHEFAVISTERQFHQAGFDIVRPNHFENVHRVLHQVEASGYRRPALMLVEPPRPLIDDEVRVGAFLAFQQKLKVKDRLPVVRRPHALSEPAEYRVWMEKYRPDVVIATNTHILHKLQRAGFAIPEQVAFVSLHVDEQAEEREIAGLADRERSARPYCLALLERKLRAAERGLQDTPTEMVYPLSFCDGASLPSEEGRRPQS